MFGERFAPKAPKTLALPRDPYPGPGAYRTLSALTVKEKPYRAMLWDFKPRVQKEADSYDGCRTRYRSSPHISIPKAVFVNKDAGYPGPGRYGPISGFTSVANY
jgi:hypothetical protein